MKTYIGIDNGVSGSIGIITPGLTLHYKTPVKKEQNYTKKKDNITRIDVVALEAFIHENSDGPNTVILIERPMVNPTRFKATLSAVRALEATICVLEGLGLPYQYIDSKEWQKKMLPSGVKGAPELKKASLDIGRRLFPQFDFKGDADGILIAEFARREKW